MATNVALTATATASNSATANGQTADKAIDGVIDGYPGDYTREWATAGGGPGDWLQLTWAAPVAISAMTAWRRQVADVIQAATVTFSDGSSLTWSGMDATPSSSLAFPARTVSWLRLTITASVPYNPGLQELQVFAPGSGVNGRLPYDLHSWAPVVQSSSADALSAPLSASGAGTGVSTRRDPGAALTAPLTAAAGATLAARSGAGAATVLPLTAAAGDGIVIATSLAGTGDSILLPFTTGNGIARKTVGLLAISQVLLLVDIQGRGSSVRQDSGTPVVLGLYLPGTTANKITGTQGLANDLNLVLPGQGQGRRYEWTFATPTDQDYQPFTPIYPNLLYYGIPYGMTVWQDADGQWQQMRGPNPNRLIGATRIYEGGRLHVLSVDEIAALTIAGYGDRIILQEMH